MVLPGPSVITNPTPHAAGVIVRNPRCQIWVDGILLPIYLDVTMTRGLDTAMATAEISVPHPLPDYVKYWSKIQIVAGTGAADPENGVKGMTTRFTGFVTSFSYQLWPPARVIHCQDVLVIASQTYTPEEMDLHGLTDQQAVQQVLSGCGYNENTWQGVTDDSGTGTILADIEEAQLFWELGETALAAIQKIDEVSLGWRTYATAGGAIVRTLVDTNPNKATPMWSFGEGVDILDGSLETETIDPAQEITVEGFDGTATSSTNPADDPFNWMNNSYWIRFLFLQTVARGSGTINPQDIAAYILSQVSKRILKVTFTTHLDLLFQAQEVVGITSEKLEIDQQFWVQSVQLHCAADGSFSQTISGISELQQTNRHIITPPVDPPPGGLIVPGGDIPVHIPPSPADPGPADFIVDFTIVAVDRELAGDPTDTGDTGSTHYIVNCEDTTTNAQVLEFTRAWDAAGPGVTVTHVEGPFATTFSTAFTDLAGATITLTLTDGFSNSAFATRSVDTVTTPVRSRKLYALTPSTYEAYNGTAWVTQPPVLPSKVQSLGGGPIWGADHYVVTSADDLATAPTEVAALSPGEDVTAIWLHEVNPNLIAIGGANGSVAISIDMGVTWTQKTPLAGEVKGIIISIFREAELHVVTPDGWYTSDDQGESWRLVRAGDFLYLELSHTRNIIVDTTGVLQVAETGAAFTGNSSPIKAATAGIRQDKFCAIAADGTTWINDPEGSLTLVAGEPIPAGDVLPGGLYRDGQVIDMVFFAAGDGGIFKSIDFLATPEGYLRLRNPDSGLLTP